MTLVHVRGFTQGVVGEYGDYFGHSLELRHDSTCRFDWRFDLIHNWAVGKWRLSGKSIQFDFVIVYDTLKRQNRADTLILSNDEIPNTISEIESTQTMLSSSGQYQDRFPVKLSRRGNRLYLIDHRGKRSKKRLRGIWPQRRWLLGYKTWPTYYRREVRSN